MALCTGLPSGMRCHHVHAGDLHTLDVVDELSTIAPVYVSEGNGDIGIIDERVKPAWSLTFGSFSIGMVHHCPSPERKGESFVKEKLRNTSLSCPMSSFLDTPILKWCINTTT